MALACLFLCISCNFFLKADIFSNINESTGDQLYGLSRVLLLLLFIAVVAVVCFLRDFCKLILCNLLSLSCEATGVSVVRWRLDRLLYPPGTRASAGLGDGSRRDP